MRNPNPPRVQCPDCRTTEAEVTHVAQHQDVVTETWRCPCGATWTRRTRVYHRHHTVVSEVVHP